ncbi:MAG: hypothetical protein ABFD76_05135 [Smithella sp.]
MTKKIKTAKGKASHKSDQFWEMQKGGPYSREEGNAVQIFKCTGCGAETVPENGWNGAPDKHRCKPGCPCNQAGGKVTIGGYSPRGRANFDRTFPNAPGAGL